MIDPAVGFSVTQWAAMMVITAAAGLTYGFVGIGFPMLATPLFGLMFGWKSAVTLMVLPTWVVTVVSVWMFRRQVDPRRVLRDYWVLVPAMLLGLVLGVQALQSVDPAWLMLLMSGVMVAFLLLDRVGATEHPGLRAHPVLLTLAFGLFAGFCEGAINVSGPILLILFLLLAVPVDAIIAMLSGVFFLGKTVQALLMAHADAFDARAMQVLVPIALIGSASYLAGLRLRARVDPAHYRTGLKAFLAVMAVGMIARVMLGLAA
jgi:uncharacterized membrane protein YfcA